MIPFAGSDFWIADLGLEFLHWPQQKLIRKQMRRSQSCDMLESTNPNPKPGAYRRVVSWIDIDTGGIVHADAYDANDRLLKQFDPSEITKVKGEWQLEEMEIRNRQAGTKTLIKFKLGE
jgi:YD repeat-containing protein